MELIYENLEMDLDDINEVDYLIEEFLEITKIIIQNEKFSNWFFEYFVEKSIFDIYLYFFKNSTMEDR